MASIEALTLHSNKFTTYRRGSPLPQLTCVGKLCNKFQPEVVQCVAVGNDGAGGIEWACSADLPSTMKFGAVEISCEGYNSPSDPYVLKGSCALEYNLIKSSNAFEEGSYYSNQSSEFPWSRIFFFGLALYCLYRLLKIPFAQYPAVPRPISNLWRGFGGGGGGGGGGPGFGGGGPPPPYSKRSDEGQGWKPGFWSGLAAGAAALQAASLLRGGGNQQQGGYRRNNGGNWGMRDDDDRGVGGSGSWNRPSGGGGGGGSGGAMRPSTGFGGTRNR